ncbi:hypothetical protein [Yoonia sp. SS1-5]|uniref:Uncharacterized protein n=1 Tax=Yoonia rhodophyticola TaxID=3137370 RepID=A0AAN0NLA7_9RHOB
MSDIADIPFIATRSTEETPLPAPVPFGAPVLIGDCVSPLAGETILGLLWKRLDEKRRDKQPRRDHDYSV